MATIKELRKILDKLEQKTMQTNQSINITIIDNENVIIDNDLDHDIPFNTDSKISVYIGEWDSDGII